MEVSLRIGGMTCEELLDRASAKHIVEYGVLFGIKRQEEDEAEGHVHQDDLAEYLGVDPGGEDADDEEDEEDDEDDG